MGGVPVNDYRDFVNGTEKIIIGVWDENMKYDICELLIKSGINKKRIFKINSYINEALKYVIFEANEKIDNSAAYWENRYLKGGTSGSGSYNRLAEFKADVLNAFVAKKRIELVLEWGCGDGNQLMLAEYPRYVGYDVAKQAIFICQTKFKLDKTKQFIWCGGINFSNNIKADLVISLDVIYHLVEDEVYNTYMEQLFSSSNLYVCIYSCDFEKVCASHIRCRKFTDYVEKNCREWRLVKYVPNRYPYNENDLDNTSWSDFYFYKKDV